MPEPFVTIADAAYVLSVDPVTIRRWIASGRLAAVRVGGTAVPIPQAALEALTGPDYSPDDWVSIADAATLYSVSEHSIRRWIGQRDVETRRLGTRATRVSADWSLPNVSPITTPANPPRKEKPHDHRHPETEAAAAPVGTALAEYGLHLRPGRACCEAAAEPCRPSTARRPPEPPTTKERAMMFNTKTKTATTEPINPHDDAVPDELRADYYAATSRPSPSAVNDRIEALARKEASLEGIERYERTDSSGRTTYTYPPTESYRAELAQRAQQIRDLDYDRLQALASHQLRIEAATIENSKRVQRDENRAHMLAEQTCPKCNQIDLDANGLVDTRDLMGETGARGRHLFRSCFGCHSVKRAQMLTQWSVNRLPGGRTRGDAVSEA